MAGYSLSPKAAADLDEIYEYTILNFGLEQAQEYLLGLHERFQTLAQNPMHGRNADQLAPELRRFAGWLGLDRISVSRRGNLSARLQRSI